MPDAIDKAMKVYLEKLGAPTDAPRSAGVPTEEESMEANFRDFLRRVGPRGGKTKALKDFAEAHTQRQLVSLEADNASLRASLAEFKGDYGKLVDLEGQAQARVAALEEERDRLRELERACRRHFMDKMVCSRCEGEGNTWADGKVHYPSYTGPTAPCPNCGGSGEVSNNSGEIERILKALHPTSEAEL
jgi:hypothetical protein